MKNLNINENIKRKFYIDKYKITSPFYNFENKKVLVASDIHVHKHVDKQIFYLLLQKCEMLKPDFILVPGDIVENNGFLLDRNEKDFLEFFIKELSQICPVIIVPGNHDVGNFNSLKDRVNLQSDKSASISLAAIKYFESWNRFNNVYFLNNQQVELSGINFIGFSPNIMTYISYDNPEIQEIFINDYLKNNFIINKNSYNVLLTHSPILLTQNYVKQMLPDVSELSDLIVTGHLHDGYLPKVLDKYFEKTNFGLFITPFVSPKKGLICRGVHDYGRGYLMVSQGFRKYTADIPLFRTLERITANDIEMLEINNGDIKQYQKVL